MLSPEIFASFFFFSQVSTLVIFLFLLLSSLFGHVETSMVPRRRNLRIRLRHSALVLGLARVHEVRYSRLAIIPGFRQLF